MLDVDLQREPQLHVEEFLEEVFAESASISYVADSQVASPWMVCVCLLRRLALGAASQRNLIRALQLALEVDFDMMSSRAGEEDAMAEAGGNEHSRYFPH